MKRKTIEKFIEDTNLVDYLIVGVDEKSKELVLTADYPRCGISLLMAASKETDLISLIMATATAMCSEDPGLLEKLTELVEKENE